MLKKKVDMPTECFGMLAVLLQSFVYVLQSTSLAISSAHPWEPYDEQSKYRASTKTILFHDYRIFLHLTIYELKRFYFLLNMFVIRFGRYVLPKRHNKYVAKTKFPTVLCIAQKLVICKVARI